MASWLYDLAGRLGLVLRSGLVLLPGAVWLSSSALEMLSSPATKFFLVSADKAASRRLLTLAAAGCVASRARRPVADSLIEFARASSLPRFR